MPVNCLAGQAEHLQRRIWVHFHGAAQQSTTRRWVLVRNAPCSSGAGVLGHALAVLQVSGLGRHVLAGFLLLAGCGTSGLVLKRVGALLAQGARLRRTVWGVLLGKGQVAG